jgi:hypothetical protein
VTDIDKNVIIFQAPSVKDGDLKKILLLTAFSYCRTVLKYTQKQHFYGLYRSVWEDCLLFAHEGRAALAE